MKARKKTKLTPKIFISGIWALIGWFSIPFSLLTVEIISYFFLGLNWWVLISLPLTFVAWLATGEIARLKMDLMALKETIKNLEFYKNSIVKGVRSEALENFLGIKELLDTYRLSSKGKNSFVFLAEAMSKSAVSRNILVLKPHSKGPILSGAVTSKSRRISFILFSAIDTNTRKFLALHEYGHTQLLASFSAEFRNGGYALLQLLILIPFFFVKLNLEIESLMVFMFFLLILMVLKLVVYPKQAILAEFTDEVKADEFALKFANKEWLDSLSVERIMNPIRMHPRLRHRPDLIKEREELFRLNLERAKNNEEIDLYNRLDSENKVVGVKGHWLLSLLGLSMMAMAPFTKNSPEVLISIGILTFLVLLILLTMWKRKKKLLGKIIERIRVDEIRNQNLTDLPNVEATKANS